MNSGDTVRAEIYISGRVQGVGFRRFAKNVAQKLFVDCNPINLRDGRVLVIAEGRCEVIKILMDELRKGPTISRVDNFDVTFKEATGKVYDFLDKS